MTEAAYSVNENVKSSLKAFDISLIKLRLDYLNFIDNSVKAATQIFRDVGLLRGFQNEDEY